MDIGFENEQNSFLNEFSEISQNNSQHFLDDFIFPKINHETLQYFLLSQQIFMIKFQKMKIKKKYI